MSELFKDADLRLVEIVRERFPDGAAAVIRITGNASPGYVKVWVRRDLLGIAESVEISVRDLFGENP